MFLKCLYYDDRYEWRVAWGERKSLPLGRRYLTLNVRFHNVCLYVNMSYISFHIHPFTQLIPSIYLYTIYHVTHRICTAMNPRIFNTR